jgi:hypothetical protein
MGAPFLSVLPVSVLKSTGLLPRPDSIHSATITATPVARRIDVFLLVFILILYNVQLFFEKRRVSQVIIGKANRKTGEDSSIYWGLRVLDSAREAGA